jgi:hypothetical protein
MEKRRVRAAREVVEVDMVLMKLTLVTAVIFVVSKDVNRTITELLTMYGRVRDGWHPSARGFNFYHQNN